MNSWPWDARVVTWGDDGLPVYDRGYTAEELRSVLGRFYGNGVFADTSTSFRVQASDGMNVLVNAGDCIIEGTYGWEGSNRSIALTAASSKDRIDTVVLRWDNDVNKRTIDLYVLQGVAADNPTRPALTRNNTVYELGLADIFVPKNTTSIAADRITDTRLESARCGIAAPFAQFDTTSFYNYVESGLADMRAELKAQTDAAVELAQSAIDETLAGKLQSQIDVLDEEVVQLKAACPFPVGFVMHMAADFNPNEIYPGTTWERMQGRFLLGSSASYARGATGGEATHTLTVNEMPSHNHGSASPTGTFALVHNLVRNGVTNIFSTAGGICSVIAGPSAVVPYTGNVSYSGSTTQNNEIRITATHTHSNNGSGAAHNNMPPYEVVDMWKRTA